MVLDCKAVRHQLGSYLTREQSAEEVERVERHLRTCPDCRTVLEREEALFTALADPLLQQRVLAVPPPLPADFTERVMARVRTERGPITLWQRLRSIRFWLRDSSSVAYGLSACLVVAAGSSEPVRSWAIGGLFNAANPLLDRAAAIWADAIVWLVHYQTAIAQVLYGLGN